MLPLGCHQLAAGDGGALVALVVSIGGLKYLLGFARSSLARCTLRLFQNDMVPVVDSYLSDYEEANFAGYSPQSPTNWTNAYELTPIVAETDEVPHTWTVAGVDGLPQTIYGALLVTPDYHLVFAERFAVAPITLFIPGQSFIYRPSVTLMNLPV
jgi:hypothetical protein